MSAVRHDAVLLADMHSAADAIGAYLANRSREDFERDQLLQDAVIRRLLVFGEAANHVSDELVADTPEIPWRAIVGMRNVLVHAYHQVDLDAVWLAATVEVPELRAALVRLQPTISPE